MGAVKGALQESFMEREANKKEHVALRKLVREPVRKPIREPNREPKKGALMERETNEKYQDGMKTEPWEELKLDPIRIDGVSFSFFLPLNWKNST